MKILPLNTNDQVALGATHVIRITHEDLDETTADTDQTLTLAVEDGSLFDVVALKLETPFEDASDGDLNDTQISVGDGGDADRFLTATQVNENGTEIDYKQGALGKAYAYNTADTVDILVESMTGKSLSDIDTGVALLFVKLADLKIHGDYE